MGGDVTLPWRSYASTNVYYGSGFANGFPGQPYPGQLSAGPHDIRSLARQELSASAYSASLNALNVANRRVELDNSLTFGGFHYNDPREIYVEFRWRFHY